MIDYRQAQKIVLEQAHSFGKEEVRLEEAFGRILAEPISADRDYPPFNRATMDGFALRYRDLAEGIRRFEVVECLFAGDQRTRSIRKGECYKIMTGAAVPDDADMVLRREEVTEGGAGGAVGRGGAGGAGVAEMEVTTVVQDSWRPYLYIARQGEDLKAGATVVASPCRCEPAVMGLLATLGKTTVMVAATPRVALLTTGNEVVEAGLPVSPVQIRNSNRWLLEGALKKNGIGLEVGRHVADDPALLALALEQMMSQDMVILSGGVSAGDADYVPDVLTRLGVRVLFHRVAMRPGKPVWCGVMPTGGIVFALPGNPFSCLVHFALLIQPYLDVCRGLRPAEPIGLPLAFPRVKVTPLDEFFPVCVSGSPAMVTPVPLNGSGDIRMGLPATALALHPAGSGDLPAGAGVLCYPYL